MSGPNHFWKDTFQFRYSRPEERPIYQQWKTRMSLKFNGCFQQTKQCLRMRLPVSKGYLIPAALVRFLWKFFHADLQGKEEVPHRLDGVLNLPNREARERGRCVAKYPLCVTGILLIAYPFIGFFKDDLPSSHTQMEFLKHHRLRAAYRATHTHNFQPSSTFEEYSVSK